MFRIGWELLLSLVEGLTDLCADIERAVVKDMICLPHDRRGRRPEILANWMARVPVAVLPP